MTAGGATRGHEDAHRVHKRVDLSRPSDRAAVVAIAIAAALALLIWSPSVGGRSPGDPSAVAADARLARCGGTLDAVEYAFTMPHARDYQTYLPAMDRVSELEIEPSALIVVFRGEFPGVATGAAPVATPPGSTLRNLCIYVGQAGQGELNYYTDISIAGMRATPNGPVIMPVPQT